MMYKDNDFFSNMINDMTKFNINELFDEIFGNINCSSEVSPEKNNAHHDSKVINTNIKKEGKIIRYDFTKKK